MRPFAVSMPRRVVFVKVTSFSDSIFYLRLSASRQAGVNNLPRVVVCSRAVTGDRTRDRKSDALPLRHHANLSACLLVTSVSPAEADEPIEVLFGV